jgi:endonuclease/exonuclease/phosphatase family metal-dependent hydrolase
VPSRHLATLSPASFSTSSQINFLEVYPSSSPSSFVFCSLYCHPQATSKDYDSISSSLRGASSLNKPILLAGDLNARNEEWLDDTTNHRGASMARLLSLHSLAVLNPTHIPRFITHPSTGSVIDLVCSTHPQLVRTIKSSFFHALVSDHHPILILLLLLNQINLVNLPSQPSQHGTLLQPTGTTTLPCSHPLCRLS